MTDNGVSFRYETRIKNKPNSQGTLFQVNPNQRTPESRQPRGYSPERYEAVRQTLGIKRSREVPGSRGGAGLHTYHEHADQLARSIASIARSTVPMSDIAPHPDKPISSDNPRLSLGVTHQTSEETGELGHYSKPGWAGQPSLAHITMSKNANGQDTTPIHEVGHHVDRAHPYTRASEQGRAEGFADSYAQTHARTPGYKQRRIEIPSHPESWGNHLQSQGMGDYYNRQHFADAYKGQHTPLNQKQFDITAPPEGHEKTFPSHHVKGQGALVQKVYGETRYGRTTPTEWHYADWVEHNG